MKLRFVQDIYDGKEIDYFPSIIDTDNIKPVYTVFPGWTSKVNESRRYKDLEDNFKNYITFIEDSVELRLINISCPDREETVLLD